MRQTRLRCEGGFTLMEVVVSMAVLMFGILMSMQLLKDMSDDIYVEQVQSDINKRVTGRLYDIVGEMQSMAAPEVALDGAVVALGARGNSITFRQVTGTDVDGNVTYSNKIRYRWIISPEETAGNGIDDDQNGVVDDGYIVREEFNAADVLVSTFPVEDFVPQMARISRREDPYYGMTISGFCVCRLDEPDSSLDREVTVTIQRSVNERMRTDNGTVATASATRTIYLLNP